MAHGRINGTFQAAVVYGPHMLKGNVMLELRPNCECCDCDLPPDAVNARICSFECTFCAACAELKLGGRCPNCAGELLARPRRPADKLGNSPASIVRVHTPEGRVSGT